MTVSCRDIINRAYRKIQFGTDAVTGDEAAAGLDALNGWFHSLKIYGVNVWVPWDEDSVEYPDPFTDDVDFDETDDFPMPLSFAEGAIYCLATRLAPEYAAPVSWDETSYIRSIQAAYLVVNEATIDDALTWRGETAWRWVL